MTTATFSPAVALSRRVSLAPHECHALFQRCWTELCGDPTAIPLLDKLNEADAVSQWLGEVVELQLSDGDAELLGNLPC